MAALTMYRGDDRSVVFTFTAPTTFAVGDVVRFTAKLRRSDEDADAVVSLTSPSGVAVSGGTATAVIAAEDTDAFVAATLLYYDWQLTTALGSTRTLDTGVILVSPDVSRTAP